MPKTIKLTQGFEAIVDDEDFYFLSRFNWYYKKGYATTTLKTFAGKSICISMHRLICPGKSGMVIDHCDRNPLNNCKDNLRAVLPGVNSHNSTRKLPKSGFVGVEIINGGRFRARIIIQGEVKELGTYATGEEASKAYNEAAHKYYGGLALTSPKKKRG